MKLAFALFLLGSIGAGYVIAAQSETQYVDPEGQYRLTLPAGWQSVPMTDSTGHPITQFVYRDNNTATLRIEPTTIPGPIDGLVDSDQAKILATANAGYNLKSRKAFTGGALPGIFSEFSTKQSGRDLTHYSYYLQAGADVWILRFAGQTNRIEILRDAIDKIARTFALSKKQAFSHALHRHLA